jgi:HEAT repeat protein
VKLPKPVVSSCVTVMIREVAPAGKPAALADLDVLTEIDGPGGVARLVEAVRAGGDCESRVPLLVGLGAPALAPVAAAVARGPAEGRECLLTALDRLSASHPAPELAPALVSALDKASHDEEKLVLAMLPRLATAPVAPLAQRLEDDKRPDEERLRAARALGACERAPAAKGALLAAAGRGPPAVRAGVRDILAALPPPLAAAARDALAGATDVRRADLLFVLGAAAAREPAERAASLALLRAPAADFETQARALGALGQLAAAGEEEAAAALGEVRAVSTDPVLRYLATRELAAAPPVLSVAPLRTALADRDPRVRETAATALGHRGDRTSSADLLAAARRERWPFARRAQVSALGELCPAGSGDLFVHSLERDAPEVRRAALTALARCREPRAQGVLQRTLGRRAEDPELRALAARLLRELGDRTAARPMAEALGRMRAEASADLAVEGVAGVVMQALAGLGGPDAVTAAVGLLADGSPVLRRAGADALGTMCDATAGARALAAAVSDKDPAVAASARAAQRRCQRR